MYNEEVEKGISLLTIMLAAGMAGCSGDNAADVVSMEPADKVEDTKSREEAKTSCAEALDVTADRMELDSGRTKLYLKVANVSENMEIQVNWQKLSLDGKPVSDELWFPDYWSPKVKAGDVYEETVFIDESMEGCAEIVLEATARETGDSGDEGETLLLTFQTREIASEDITPETITRKSVVEEMEIYNGNGLRIIVPGQTICEYVRNAYITNNDGIAVYCESTGETDFDVLGLKFDNICVNGEMLYEHEGNNVEAADPLEFSVNFERADLVALHESGADSRNISFIMTIQKDFEEVDTVDISIPVIYSEGD